MSLPVTKSGDGGDSAAICGTLLALQAIGCPQELPQYLGTTTPVRHPDTNKWYGRPWRFSRDQLIGLLSGLTISRHPRALTVGRALFKMHLKRGLVLAWNKYRNFQYETLEEHLLKSTPDVKWDMKPKACDITGPTVLALWIRFFRFRPLYPLLLVLDVELLISAITWRYKKTNLVRNHLLGLHVSTTVLPTPVAMLAKKISPRKDLIARMGVYCSQVGEFDSSRYFAERLLK